MDQTLTKAAADLAAGRTTLARQRLRGLVGSFPDRLDLREHLAETYRRDGDLAQAGRWSYLAAERDERGLAAFTRTYHAPCARMRALAWRTAEDSAGTHAATRLRQLRQLREQAEQEAGAPVSWHHPHRPPAPATRREHLVGCLGLVLGLIALVVTGLGRMVVTGARTVWGWVS